MFPLQQFERVESRVLGAVRFFDATSGMTIKTPLNILAPPESKIIRNRSGLYVVHQYAPLQAHTESFISPPEAPPIASLALVLSVEDPAGVYLSRSAEIRLPRDPSPENVAAAGSLFRQIDVELYRAPTAPVGVNWAVLRVNVVERDSGDALGGALLRVMRNGETLARGMTDWRGEALVPIVGIPITTWSEDENEVTVTEIGATIEALFDSAAGSVRTPANEISASAYPERLPVSDPERIAANPDAPRAQSEIRIATGRSLALTMQLELPA